MAYIARSVRPKAHPVAAMLIAGLMTAAAGPAAAVGPESIADVAEPLLPAVVNISSAQTIATARRGVPTPRVPEGSPFQDFFDEFFNQPGEDGGGQPRRVQSLGSGFVVDSGGLVVTNNHVIEDADEITVNFSDGTSLIAEVVGRDEKTDLALLEVETDRPLTALTFGNSESLRVGDWVMAIGNPFGLGGTVTVGIVSARNRDINAGPYDNFIQTDASINRGNSGGPLFNMEGEVVGINTAIISPTGGSIGIGFAVPAETAVGVIDQLRQFGETRRGWLGVRIQQVTDEIAEGLSMEEPRGALVAGVTDDGPAAEAGIEPGDVIILFDGKPVDNMNELPRMVASEPIGKEVEVVLLRKGEEQTIRVTLGRLEDAEKILAAVEAEEEPDIEPTPAVITGPLGLSLSDLSADLRKQYGIDDEVTGVVVTGVADGSAAADKRLQPGDVIVEIAQERVSTPAEVEEKIAALKQDGRKSALLLLANKDNDLRFVAITIDE